MHIFMDTEFEETRVGGRGSLHLISVGMIADDGRTLYMQDSGYVPDLASPWLQEHVIPQLDEYDN